jgi:hypothetical protein
MLRARVQARIESLVAAVPFPQVPPLFVVELTWVRDGAKEHQEKREPTGSTIVLERDARWHSLTKQRPKLWIGNAADRETGPLLDGECEQWEACE